MQSTGSGNETILSCHQPNLLPWLGFWHKIVNSDIFVILDDVQFSKGGYTNRCKIWTPNGERWLTIPLKKHGLSHRLIREVKIDGSQAWKKKIIGMIEQNYRKAKFFDEFFPSIRDILLRRYDRLLILNIILLYYILEECNISIRIELASQLLVEGNGVDRLINIAKQVGADAYLSGQGAKAYQSVEDFTRHGIELKYSNFQAEPYSQFGGEFIPNLSIIDSLFHCGPEVIKRL